jgi:hypothetical protein
VELTVEITNYEAITDPAVVPAVVGAGLDPEAAGVVGGAIDGVALDARPLLVRNDDGTVALTLVVGTDGADSVRDRLKLERPGLYPVRVQLLIGDPSEDNVVATASTVVQRLAGAVDLGITAPRRSTCRWSPPPRRRLRTRPPTNSTPLAGRSTKRSIWRRNSPPRSPSRWRRR